MRLHSAISGCSVVWYAHGDGVVIFCRHGEAVVVVLNNNLSIIINFQHGALVYGFYVDMIFDTRYLKPLPRAWRWKSSWWWTRSTCGWRPRWFRGSWYWSRWNHMAFIVIWSNMSFVVISAWVSRMTYWTIVLERRIPLFYYAKIRKYLS